MLATSTAVVFLIIANPAWSGETPGPMDLIALVEKNPRLAVAAADVEIARARLAEAEAGLMPKVSLTASYDRFESAAERETDNNDLYSTLEVVQPLYDFGATASRTAAAKLELAAAETDRTLVRNLAVLEALALYYDLAASEFEVQARLEEHSSAFVRHGRSVELAALGKVGPLEVAERLHRVERTRLEYYRARSRNRTLRFRLTELTGAPFDVDIPPPSVPEKKPVEMDVDRMVALAESKHPELLSLSQRKEALSHRRNGVGRLPRVEAYGSLGETNRELRGRDRWAVGARVVWPFYEGGRIDAERVRLVAEESKLMAVLEAKRREAGTTMRVAVLRRADAWQHVVSAQTGLDFARRQLIERQTRYQQEQVADLGRAMVEISDAEAELVRAIGAYAMANVRLAVLMGEHPARGLDAKFFEETNAVSQ